LCSPNEQPKHIRIASHYVGWTESRGNRGTVCDSCNSSVHIPKGSPYCASFVSWILTKAGADEPITRTGLARNFYSRSKDRYSAGSVLKGKNSVHIGDLIIWARGNGIKGHVGMAYKNWKGKKGKTLEANTSSGKIGSQSDGGGIYIRTRSIQPYNYFRIIGFAKVIYK